MSSEAERPRGGCLEEMARRDSGKGSGGGRRGGWSLPARGERSRCSDSVGALEEMACSGVD